MIDFETENKKRFDFFMKNQDELFSIIRKAQGTLTATVLKFILELSTDDLGNFKPTQTNVKSLIEIERIVQKFNRQQGSYISRWIVKRISQLLGLNKSYFDAMLSVDESIEARARRKIMASIGYNEGTRTLIKGGYLASLTSGSSIGSEIALSINRAIALKMNLSDFQKEFKDKFTSSPQTGLGVLERHYYRKTYDLFQQYDRQIQDEYATELKLQYAYYAGTIKDNTRDFCRQRVNLLYSRNEIISWKLLQFKGRVEPYDPIRDAGSVNCRHAYSWISNELADILLKTTPVNTYHTVLRLPKI